jgi:glucokinase
MTLIEASNAGEARAVEAIRMFAAHLAAGCAILVQLLDPEALILAGGLAQNNALLIPSLEKALAALVPVWEQRRLKIVNSSVGYHAGVLGAAALAMA